MSQIKACRCCLVTNSTLHEVSSDIAAIFEKLCGFPFQSSDNKPKLICSQCWKGLQNCIKLHNECVAADKILCHLLDSNIGLTQETVNIIDRQSLNLLSNSNLKVFSISSIDILPDIQVLKVETDRPANFETVKLPTQLTDVKKEIENEQNHVVEEDNRCDSDSEDDLPLKSITSKRNCGTKNRSIVKTRRLKKEELLLKGAFKEAYAKVIFLTKEQQHSEMVERSHSDNYLNSTYKCTDCYKGFLDVNAFRNHVMTKHDKSRGQFVCSLCKNRYATSRQLNTHTYTSHSRRYQCVQCLYKSLTAQQAREHEKWHKGYTYDCRLCGQQFGKPSSHLTHVRKAHPSAFICEKCGDSFISEHGLTMHRRKVIHASDKDDGEDTEPASSRNCSVCNIQFTNRNAWIKHVLTSSKHNADLQNRTTCPICDFKYEHKSDVAMHLKTHKHVLRRNKISEVEGESQSIVAPDIKVNCDVCSAVFNSKIKLRCHVKLVHLGQKYNKDIVCEVCGKHCTSNATLKYHQRTHSGERPFPCSSCPKRFSNRNLLRIHTRTHTDERPYACDVCGKRFRQKPSLNRHARVHSGARPYECQYCAKSFTQSNSLKHHVNSVHLKLPRKDSANKGRIAVTDSNGKTVVEK